MRIGGIVLPFGLVIVLLGVGGLKFTAYESKNIEPLVSHSPLMSWGYSLFSTRGFSALIGCVDIVLGAMIAMRYVWPQLSAWGSLGAVAMFLITLSFVFSTPGVWEPGYGFPFPSSSSGQFLLKDVLLVGTALWTAGEAMITSTFESS